MKKKKITPEQRAKQFKSTYFFGYGSLLIPEGINGRGLVHKYVEEDLFEATLTGYERGMNAFFQGRNFYGLLENKSASCNGVIFKIDDWYDYRALLMNEGATSRYRELRTYWPTDVTKQITGWTVPTGSRVITLIGKEDKSNKGHVSRHYVSFCDQAAKRRSPSFRATFLETGGVPFERLGMKKIAKEHNFKI